MSRRADTWTRPTAAFLEKIQGLNFSELLPTEAAPLTTRVCAHRGLMAPAADPTWETAVSAPPVSPIQVMVAVPL